MVHEHILQLDLPQLPLSCHPIIIIQARMNSTRLPGKVMKLVNGIPLLQGLLERLRGLHDSISMIVATTTSPQDDIVTNLCHRLNISVFRGSEENVLDRYAKAVATTKANVVVRLTADCPLHDPTMVRAAVGLFERLNVDYLSNTISRTYPRGYDIEVMTREALERADHEATLPGDREHVTSYITCHPETFRLASFIGSEDLSSWRLTVDTPEDLALVEQVMANTRPPLSFEHVCALLHRHVEWRRLNAHIQQKQV